MASIRTIKLPRAVRLRPPHSTRIMALAHEGAVLDLPMLTLPRGADGVSYGVRLSDEDERVIAEYMQRRAIREPVSRVIAGLAYAAWRRRKSEQSSSPKGKKLVDHEGFFGGRREQERYYRSILNATKTNRDAIVLAEGGTGLGKSRVLAQLALDLASGDAPVIVAAPTIQIMAQIADEFVSIATGRMPGVAVILGKSQFIDSQKLAIWIDAARDDDDAKAAEEWMKQGAPPVPNGSYGERLHRFCPAVAWLADDLMTIAPSAPVADLTVDDLTKEDDPGRQICRDLRERAQNARIVMCSHAALVMDRKLKRMGNPGFLPDTPTVMLIDEAHQLASVAEAAHSSSCSLVMLRQVLLHMRSHVRGAGTCSERLERLIQQARKAPDGAAVTKDFLEKNEVGKIVDFLKRIPEGIGLSGAQKSIIQAGISVFQAVLRDDFGLYIRLSPVRRWPSLLSGPRSLRYFFKSFWESTSSAVLCSGTLFLPGKTPLDPLNISYVQTILSLPTQRVIATPPVHPKWATSYALMKPLGEELDSLLPPTERNGIDVKVFEVEHDRWLNAVAAKIGEIAETALGGTLVLIPGYETVEALELRLVGLGGRLVVQARDSGFAAARRQFINLYGQGVKPVWLATGPAWTGLDLSDHEKPAHEDFMLTDLVIPRIPFGTEHSTIHESRKEIHGFVYEVYRAAFQFRQGLGRLMRREGVAGRRLWLLDARMWRDDAPWYIAYFRRFF